MITDYNVAGQLNKAANAEKNAGAQRQLKAIKEENARIKQEIAEQKRADEKRIADIEATHKQELERVRQELAASQDEAIKQAVAQAMAQVNALNEAAKNNQQEVENTTSENEVVQETKSSEENTSVAQDDPSTDAEKVSQTVAEEHDAEAVQSEDSVSSETVSIEDENLPSEAISEPEKTEVDTYTEGINPGDIVSEDDFDYNEEISPKVDVVEESSVVNPQDLPEPTIDEISTEKASSEIEEEELNDESAKEISIDPSRLRIAKSVWTKPEDDKDFKMSTVKDIPRDLMDMLRTYYNDPNLTHKQMVCLTSALFLGLTNDEVKDMFSLAFDDGDKTYKLYKKYSKDVNNQHGMDTLLTGISDITTETYELLNIVLQAMIFNIVDTQAGDEIPKNAFITEDINRTCQQLIDEVQSVKAKERVKDGRPIR